MFIMDSINILHSLIVQNSELHHGAARFFKPTWYLVVFICCCRMSQYWGVLMTWKKDCLNITMSRAWTSKPHLHAAAMMINITKLTHVVLVSRQLLYSDILTVWILKKDYFEFWPNQAPCFELKNILYYSMSWIQIVWFHCSAIIFLVPKVFNDTSYVFWFLAIAQTLTHIIVE